MTNLPENCTIEQALEICREWSTQEQARLLAEYAPAEDEPYEPSTEDREWLAPLDLADDAERWSEYREWAEWADRVEEIHRSDLDLML